MPSWFTHEKAKVPTPSTVPIAEGYYAPMTAEALLAAEHRQKLLERIWQYTALSQPQFEQLYLRPIRRYADYVQQLPASESHHHAYPGGMLDHGLELVACSLKLRQSHLLPSGAAPEDQAAQADAWSAGIAYGALLHDIGKIAVDLQVEDQGGQPWHPWHGPLDQPYRFRYLKGRDYQLHGAAAGLLYTQVLDRPILDWLSGYPALWGKLLYLLANHYEHAGILGELVLLADRVSTAQNIGANPSKALQAPTHSLQHHLLSGLRHLVKNEFKLNQPGAAGWLTDEHLWLVSKTATDKLRAYLLAQSVDGIPSSNIALFDELQSHGLVDATPDGKAIWIAAVTDEDWQQQFTFLRLQPSLIWADETRPPTFTGTLEADFEVPSDLAGPPTSPGTGNATPTAVDPASANANRPNPTKPCPSEMDDSDYLGPLLELFETPEFEPSAPPSSEPELTPENNNDLGHQFVDWLRTGLLNHSLIINDSQAKVHTVNGTFFLVTPGIFQRYTSERQPEGSHIESSEAWLSVQKRFEKLDLHLRRPDGQNIWTCQVKGPRKRGKLNGYLLKDSQTISELRYDDNPFLRLTEG
ncbi:MobH family relaxase (plasmid) [Pseudomonas sp. App30]|uniref:MobH family relaxase n=1 Tax=Pseudomonas sp. App30 TaxID=3068990 RepID=UPI003A810C14